MKILIVEPFFGGSHAKWAEGFKAHSRHDVEILSLEGRSWKWRMRGGAVTLARLYLEKDLAPDLILATDMLDLALFLSLTRARTAQIPIAVYFHENQLGYPWSPNEKESARSRRHYGFINFTTALTADRVFFNSGYHMEAFLGDLAGLLKGFPDHNEIPSIERIREKSAVLYPGMDFARLDAIAPPSNVGKKKGPLLLLWNHRWEYDKNPAEFFRALYLLADRGFAFEVAILGEHFAKVPDIFKEARARLGKRIVHFGFVKGLREYAEWLKRAEIAPVTSKHDFFGFSVVEALYFGVRPLLPKRLAYPEHIPKALHESFFYVGFDDLVRRLEAALIEARGEGGGRALAVNDALREHVARYSWLNMAPLYDKAMEDVVGRGGQ